jgi:hypothetical protein
MDNFPPSVQRPALLEFAEALNSRPSALRRDECGDWRINGRHGHICAVPNAFHILFFARNGVTEWDGEGPHLKDYVRAKRALVFCRLAQDGTGEGIFVLDRLPLAGEADVIRDVLGVPRRVVYSDEVLAAKRESGRLLAERARAAADPQPVE